MTNYEEMISPYMKQLGQHSLTFEIQGENEDPIVVLDDIDEHPVIFRVSNPEELVKRLGIVALINYMSDFELTVGHNENQRLEGSRTMQDHYPKVFDGTGKCVVTFGKSTIGHWPPVKIVGFYVVPQMFLSTDNIFRLILVNGERCEARWVLDIVNESFSDVTYKSFCYIIEISCDDFNLRRSEVKEVLFECCRSMVKEFLFNLKDLAVTEFAAQQEAGVNPLVQSSMAGRHTEVTNSDVIDLDEFPDEMDFENLCLLTESEYKWDKCSVFDPQDLLLPDFKLENALTKLWLCEKWLTANSDQLVVSQVDYDTDDNEILRYKPTTGKAKDFWEIQRGKNKKPVVRKSVPLTKPKISYLEELPSTSFNNNCIPKRPFDYKIPKKVDRSPPTKPQTTQSFYGFEPEVATSIALGDSLKELEKYIQVTSDHSVTDPAPMDHDGIILSSDEEGSMLKDNTKKPKKFFSDPDLAKKRVTLKSETVSKKPRFTSLYRSCTKKPGPSTRALLKTLDESSPEVSHETNKIQRNGPPEDMLLDIERPRLMREAKTEKARELANRHRLNPYIPTLERRSMEETSRGKRMLNAALNSIKKQDSAHKSPLSSQSKVTAVFEIHDTPQKEEVGSSGSQLPKLTFFGRSLDVRSIRPKPEINFELMDYD